MEANMGTKDEGSDRKRTRLARGSAPTKSHKNAPGRHRFSADNQPPKSKVGRPKGSQNKLTRELRELIVEAAERLGRDGEGEEGLLGYLMWLGRKVPGSYAVLLGGVMPVHVNATVTHKQVKTLEEAVAEAKARGLPPQLIEYLNALDDEPGEDDEPNPYEPVIDLEAEPPKKTDE
jgi:hypothetical protein